MKRISLVLLAFLALPIFVLGQNARMLTGVNVQTGSSYNFVPKDATRLVVFNSAGAVAATLPSGATLGFLAGHLFSVSNIGAGTVTITCTGCLIFSTNNSGSGTLVLGTGAGADIYSSGLNYYELAAGIVNVGSLPNPATFPGAVTINAPFSLTGTNPSSFQFSNTGTFTNTQMNLYVQSLVNGCNPSTEFTLQQGANFGTEGVTGCLHVPNTSTVHQASGVAGYVVNDSTTTFGVGVYGSARVGATGAVAEAMNTVAADQAAIPGTVIGYEVDTNVNNVGSTVAGMDIFGAWTVQPTGSANAINIAQPGSGSIHYQDGIVFLPGVTNNTCAGGGNCGALFLFQSGTGAGQDSQQILFNSTSHSGLFKLRDSSGDFFMNSALSVAGTLTTSSGGIFLPGATSGTSTLLAANTGGGVATLPAGAGTLCYTSTCAGTLSGQVLGQIPYGTSSSTIGTISNEFHTTGVGLVAAVAQCVSVAPSPCNVVIDPSVTPINISSPLAIGNAGGGGSTQAITVEDRGTTLNCTDTTGGRDCIELGQFGHLVCAGKGALVNNTGCAITSASNANVTSLVTNLIQNTSPAQSDFTLIGFNIAPALTAIVTRAPLWLVGVEGKGIVRDVSVEGTAVWTGGPPAVLTGSSGYGVSLEDSSAVTSNMNVINFDNLAIICGGRHGCIPLHIMSGANASVSGTNYAFNGLSLEDPDISNGQAATSGGCIDGNGCMLLIDGSEEWNGAAYQPAATNHTVSGITINNVYFEYFTGTQAIASYIQIRNARDVEINGAIFSGNSTPNITNCLYIAPPNPGIGSQGAVSLNGRVVANRCTNTINNAISGLTRTSAVSPNINYLYPGTNNGANVDAYVVDGSLQVGGATITAKAGAPAGNCAVGDLATNKSAGSASTVLYVCQPANTWTAVTVP